MRKPKKNAPSNSSVRIYHHELNLEYEYNTTYFLITEIENGKPLRTFHYKIPDNYKDNRLKGEQLERYAPFCPN